MEASLQYQVGELLKKLSLQLVVAESCTGGLVCNILTDMPEASRYFLGGIVCYNNEAKEDLLAVSPLTLQRYGAVSEQTVLEMARGVRAQFSRQAAMPHLIVISISGIAGPGGGTPEKPVGLVWIGLSSSKGEQAWRFQWSGSRAENKLQSARAALNVLRQYLKKYADEKN